jgi:hypothetical protein
VGIVEARQHAPPFRVDDGRRRHAPTVDLPRTSDIDNAIADDRDRIRVGLKSVAGPDTGVGDDEIRREARGTHTAHSQGWDERD